LERRAGELRVQVETKRLVVERGLVRDARDLDRPLLELGELRSLSGLEEGDLDALRGDASDHDVRPLGEGIRDAPRVDLLRKGFATVLGSHGFPVLANLPVLVAAESLARLLNPLVPLLRRLDPVA